MNKKKYIGIDIGGTAVKIGSVDEDGTIHATETYAVNFDGYETPILQTVVKSCHNFLEKYRENASEICRNRGVSNGSNLYKKRSGRRNRRTY